MSLKFVSKIRSVWMPLKWDKVCLQPQKKSFCINQRRELPSTQTNGYYQREISWKVARPSEGVLSWRLDDWGWLAGDVGLRLLVVAPRVRILHLLALALGLAKKPKSCQRYLVLNTHCIGSHSGGNIHTRIEIPKTSSDQLPATVGGWIEHVS